MDENIPEQKFRKHNESETELKQRQRQTSVYDGKLQNN